RRLRARPAGAGAQPHRVRRPPLGPRRAVGGGRGARPRVRPPAPAHRASGTMFPMTQQPFSRPGAIDLSALKRPATPPSPAGPVGGSPGAPSPTAPSSGTGGSSPYAVDLDEQNFQQVLEASMTAPVLLVFYSRTRMPESGQLADDLRTLS